MNIQNQLFQAMEIIAKKQMERQEFSKIIKGIVASSETNQDGSYNIYYLDATIKAYPQNTALKYSEGETVLILLPNGNLNDKKMIMSTAANKVDSLPTIDEETIQDMVNSIVTTGRNYIINPLVPITLNKTSLSYPITIDPVFLDHYVRNHSHIRIRSVITSSFNRLELSDDFEYGIKITIRYEDGSSQDFDFSYLNMAGNIYQLNGNVQDLVFEINGALKPIEAFGEVYLRGTFGNGYVTFEKITLELLSDILADIITNKKYLVEVYSEAGTVFSETYTGIAKLVCRIIGDNGIDVDPYGVSFMYEWYEITFDTEGNKIKPANPFSRERVIEIDMNNNSTGTKFYECDVYNKYDLIKKLDLS